MIIVPDATNLWIHEHGDGLPEHYYPADDVKPHITDGSSPCWCRPIDNGAMLVHNSMDGREAFENGLRRPS